METNNQYNNIVCAPMFDGAGFDHGEALELAFQQVLLWFLDDGNVVVDVDALQSWIDGLIGSLERRTEKLEVVQDPTSPDEVPERPSRTILELLATLLLHPLLHQFQDRGAKSIQNLESDLGDVGRVLEASSMLHKCTRKGKVSSLKELYQNRELFKTLRGGSAAARLGRRQLVKCLLEPVFHGADGQKFLAWCLGSIESSVVDEAIVLVESLVTGGATTTVNEGTPLIESLASIWHMAWKVASDPPIKFAMEHVVEKWTHLCLKSDKPISTRYALLLSSFHNDRDAVTAEFLCRTLPGVLHELLHAANWKVRQNAVLIFCRTFPLVDLSLPAREYELEMGRNLQCLLRFIHDPHPQVRAVAAKSIPVLLFNCWEIIPSALVAQLLCDLIEKLSRDTASAVVREATLQGLTTLVAHPMAQEPLKAGLPQLKNSLHDTNPSVRLAMAKLLFACGHIPEYHFALVCPLPEIFRRLLCESVTVEIEQASTPHYDPLRSISYQICETLAILLSASLYEKHSNVTSQVDKLLKVARESPAVLSPLLRFSRKQAAPLDRLRLSAALFMTAHHHSGAAVNPDALTIEGAVLGSVLNNVAAELLLTVPIKATNETNTTAKPTKQRSKKKPTNATAPEEEALPAEQLTPFFSSKFPAHQFVPYIREGCMLALNRTATDLYGFSVIQVLRALLLTPGYQPDSDIITAVTDATMQCQAIGSEAWTQLLQLCDTCQSETVTQYINDVVSTLTEALAAIISHLLGSESRLEPSDVNVALMFLSALPKILDLRVIGDESLQMNVLKLCDTLIQHLIDSPDSVLPADQTYFAFWMEGIRLATTVLLHLGDTPRVHSLQDSFQRLCNRLQSTDRFEEDLLGRLLSTGSSVLKSDMPPRLAARERQLYAAISDCLGAVSMFVAPGELNEEHEEGHTQESLYGVRNLMLRWMLCLTASSARVFYTHYLAFWDHTSRLLRSLIASRRVTLLDLYATYALFCCFSFVDANPWPSHWRFEVDGMLVIEPDGADENEVEDEENRPPGKRHRGSHRGGGGGHHSDPAGGGCILASPLSLPASLCNRIHPRLNGLLGLTKYVLKESKAIGNVAEAVLLLEQVHQSFTGQAAKPDGTMTLSSKWMQHLPPPIRTFIGELVRGIIRGLTGGSNGAKSATVSPERTGGGGHNIAAGGANSARERPPPRRFSSSYRNGEEQKEETAEALEALLHSTGKTPSRACRSTL